MSSRRVGSSTPSLRVAHPTDHSTTLVSMPVSRCRNGARRDGYTPTIHAAGSNGTAGTTWGDECPTRTLGRSDAGRQFAVMCVSFSLRASLAMSGAAGSNGRRCCTGPTTAASCYGNSAAPEPDGCDLARLGLGTDELLVHAGAQVQA